MSLAGTPRLMRSTSSSQRAIPIANQSGRRRPDQPLDTPPPLPLGATGRGRGPLGPVPIRRPGPAHGSRLTGPARTPRRQEEDAPRRCVDSWRSHALSQLGLGRKARRAAACRHRQSAAGAFRRDAWGVSLIGCMLRSPALATVWAARFEHFSFPPLPV